MRRHAGTGLLASVLSLCITACGGTQAPPSVLLISIDTLRADYLHSYGFPAESSPHIDALAARGVLFDNAVATATMTAPAHASIMTSRYVRGHSIGASNGSTRLRGGTTLAEHFSAAGYATAAFVTNVVLSHRTALNRGFEVYDEEFRLTVAAPSDAGTAAPAGEAQRTTERATAWLEESRRRPFFVWVHYQDPHGGFTPPAPYDMQFPDVPIGPNIPLPVLAGNAGPNGIPAYQALPGVRTPWKYAGLYAGEIAYTDFWVGVLIKEAERAAGGRRLVILLTADHGESFGEFDYFFQHGHATTPELASVPLILAAPTLSPERRQDLVSQVDIFPTLLELAGLPRDPEASGLSLVPYLIGGKPLPPRLVFCDIGYELSAYSERGYVRVRGGPNLPPPGRTVASEGAREAPRLVETWQRGADGRWQRSANAASLDPAIETYLRSAVARAPAIGELAERDAERLRALGYLPPRKETLGPRPEAPNRSDTPQPSR